jgi:hypothetical protein
MPLFLLLVLQRAPLLLHVETACYTIFFWLHKRSANTLTQRLLLITDIAVSGVRAPLRVSTSLTSIKSLNISAFVPDVIAFIPAPTDREPVTTLLQVADRERVCLFSF